MQLESFWTARETAIIGNTAYNGSKALAEDGGLMSETYEELQKN